MFMPKDLMDKKKDEEHKPTTMEVVQYHAIFNVDLPDIFFAVSVKSCSFFFPLKYLDFYIILYYKKLHDLVGQCNCSSKKLST